MAANPEGVATILLYEGGVFSSTVSFSASPRSLGFSPVVDVANTGIRLVLSIGDTLSGAGRLAEDLYSKKELYKAKCNNMHCIKTKVYFVL